LITKLRKNMKNRLLPLFDKLLLTQVATYTARPEIA
jgi:hypothetical protein